jgi:hypothetical protein
VTTALFQQAKIKLTQENYAGALADLTTLRSRNLSLRGMLATTNLAEVNFLRAYCPRKAGQVRRGRQRIPALAEVRSGAAGYGHRASEHLKALETNGRARSLVAARHESFPRAGPQRQQLGQCGSGKDGSKSGASFHQ